MWYTKVIFMNNFVGAAIRNINGDTTYNAWRRFIDEVVIINIKN